MSYMHTKIGKNDTIYHPTNKEKFIGKEGYCVCRSSWELVFCKWCNANKAVIQWSAEPFGIPYIDKTQKDYKGQFKKRRYFPDFLCRILNSKGEIDTWLVEIKPYSQTIPPTKGRKSKKTMIYEAKTYSVNQSKWKSAEAYCKRKGWFFKILTEKQLLR